MVRRGMPRGIGIDSADDRSYMTDTNTHEAERIQAADHPEPHSGQVMPWST
jgi:hypothetical protein